MNLKKIMEDDAMKKREFKDKVNKRFSQVSDFGQDNVLSYVYTKKEHKSYKLGQKNDYLVGLIQKNFSSSEDLGRAEDLKTEMYLQ